MHRSFFFSTALFLLLAPAFCAEGAESGTATEEKLRALQALEKQLPEVPEAPPQVPTPPRIRPTPPPPPKLRELGPTGAPAEAPIVREGPASGRFGGKAAVWWSRRYYFRGVRFSRNDVLQARAALWYQGIKVSGFTNYDFGPDEANEIDGTVSYSIPVSADAVLEAGYTYYGYPHRDFDDTQEIFAGISQQWHIDASIYGYYDFDEGRGGLWEFTLGKRFRYEFIEPYVRATAVLNGKYFNDDIEFSHGLFTAGLPILLGDHLALRGELTYQWGWQGWTDDTWWAVAGAEIRF